MALTRKINQKYIYDIPKDIFIFWYTYRTLGEVILERIVTRKGPLCIFACKVCTLEYFLWVFSFSFLFVLVFICLVLKHLLDEMILLYLKYQIPMPHQKNKMKTTFFLGKVCLLYFIFFVCQQKCIWDNWHTIVCCPVQWHHSFLDVYFIWVII